MSEAQAVVAPAAVLQAGESRFSLLSDVLHVLGSGEKAHLRLAHRSIRPAHAFVTAHAGRFLVEPIEGAPVAVDGVPIDRETEMRIGSTLMLGEVPLVLHAGEVAAAAAPPTPPDDFSRLMAEQLRRAPWFAVSLLVHLALLLLLRWYVTADAIPDKRYADFAITPFADNDVPAGFGEDDEPLPEVVPLEDQIDESLVQESLDLPVFEDDPEPLEFRDPEPIPLSLSGREFFTQLDAARSDSDVMKRFVGSANGAGDGTDGDFVRTVGGLRKSGLEVVLVFDSTGSMGSVLDATRRELGRMLEAMQALVPRARVGIVTYRDEGRDEAYLTRELEIDDDVYRALMFIQTVRAGGGGDHPEAVAEALDVAYGLNWRGGAERVVVLIGDAPAHNQSMRKLRRVVRRFAKDEKASTHTILTTSRTDRSFDPTAEGHFVEIARSGHGKALRFEGEDTILRQILDLSIGGKFRPQVDRVYKILFADARKTGRAIPPEAVVEREFRKREIDARFARDLIRTADRRVAEQLIDLCSDRRFPRRGRNAAAWVLQEMLGLARPPLGLNRTSGPLTRGAADALRAQARSLGVAKRER